MHDRTVRPGTGYRIEAEIPKILAGAPECREPIGRGQLIDRPTRRLAGQPGEEACHGDAVAPVGRTAAV